MVVEFLTFEVPAARLSAWLAADRAIWTAFLSRQPGFVRKEVWSDRAVENDSSISTVHAVIWWDSMAEWKAITAEQVDAVDRDMAERFRGTAPTPTMRSFEVVAP